MSLDSRLERILAGKPKPLLDAVTASRLLLQTAVLLEQRVNEALAPHALHMKEYLALHLLADSVHEPLRPSALSVSLSATRTQVTRLLDGLERRGLVVRTADAQDRRSLQLQLTEPGSALLARTMPVVQSVYQQTWSSIGDSATHAMQQQLRQVLDRLQNMDAGAIDTE
ncbi:MarR family winged helix-turn-helix transcriptional regulator [Diaphorobacter caeni]|uniref:MarR family winged helix-turn-helix transcriptional regulator n=1 Tax=Diaphorobacter caeni TaxID=2784387 RepID=UPI00188EE40A|nr:MarR family transcriptional regulator [Diaphorobacter caeni]MBF5004952.1 MarR family transcriptional regulator [Diaphorobacter caeni]